MTNPKEKQPLKSVLKKYVSEILIIFIGISISFWFDEWRDNKKDDETIKKHLIGLKNNLIQDTLSLSGSAHFAENWAKGINKLAYFQQNKEILDSLDLFIDMASSYSAFKSNMMTYEEIKQNAHTNLIKNDSLKKLFFNYYTLMIPYCIEWCDVDKNVTMTQLIPEMTKFLPVVKDSLNIVSATEKIKALKTNQIRNLLLTNAVYKQEAAKAFLFTKAYAKNLIQKIEEELAK